MVVCFWLRTHQMVHREAHPRHNGRDHAQGIGWGGGGVGVEGGEGGPDEGVLVPAGDGEEEWG